MTFHEEYFLVHNNGSRPAIVFHIRGNDAVKAQNNRVVGANTDSLEVNKVQTGAIDANKVADTLELPLSPTGRATSTTIDISQCILLI